MSVVKQACAALLVAVGLSAGAAPAFAADLAEPMTAEPVMPFDISFGVKLASEYNLRSVSQTKGDPAVQGYAELSAFDWIYVGVWASSVHFGGNSPAAEVDYYGGVRHTFGALTLDAGYVWIDYPGETSGFHEIDFGKAYGIVKYALTDNITIGANLYWADKFLGYKNVEQTHSSAFGKIALPFPQMPNIGTYISGEIGKAWVSKDFAPDYTYWNAGGGFTYKAMTVDLRYIDSNLSKTQCALSIGQRSSCGSRFLASLSFDTSLSKLK